MPDNSNIKRYAVKCIDLPSNFPTHKHDPAFWEALGRAVATFGFLEETIGKAIFAFTGTRNFPEEIAEQEFAKWVLTLNRAISDPLGGLIQIYGKSVRDNDAAFIDNLDDLLNDIQEASAIRNLLCHASWRVPDLEGRSEAFFVDRKGQRFDRAIDIVFLQQVQRQAVELACAVINTVTHMGWQFPGSGGPGKPIWPAPTGEPLGRR